MQKENQKLIGQITDMIPQIGNNNNNNITNNVKNKFNQKKDIKNEAISPTFLLYNSFPR